MKAKPAGEVIIDDGSFVDDINFVNGYLYGKPKIKGILKKGNKCKYSG